MTPSPQATPQQSDQKKDLTVYITRARQALPPCLMQFAAQFQHSDLAQRRQGQGLFALPDLQTTAIASWLHGKGRKMS